MYGGLCYDLAEGFEYVNCDILLKNVICLEFIAEWDGCLNYTIVTKNIKSPNSNWNTYSNWEL
jgi:hypothetical protein